VSKKHRRCIKLRSPLGTLGEELVNDSSFIGPEQLVLKAKSNILNQLVHDGIPDIP
jgi:hypothetical protein